MLPAAQEIMQHFKQGGFDMLLLDTAGRMHVDGSLLDELAELVSSIKPQEKLLVIDGMVGQASLAVAQAFHERVGISAAIITKMDSDTRGGVAFAFRYALKKPIIFMGIGETLDDLEQFKPERIAQRMFDLGDMATLIERAATKIEAAEQEQIQKKMLDGSMTLVDFAKQLTLMNKFGSLQSLLKYIPGMGRLALDGARVEQAEREVKKFKAIIGSMTQKERLNHKILNASLRTSTF